MTSSDEDSRREPEGRREGAPNAQQSAPAQYLLDVAGLAAQLGVRERFVRRLSGWSSHEDSRRRTPATDFHKLAGSASPATALIGCHWKGLIHAWGALRRLS